MMLVQSWNIIVLALSLLDLLAFAVAGSFGCCCSAGVGFFLQLMQNVFDNLLLVAIC